MATQESVHFGDSPVFTLHENHSDMIDLNIEIYQEWIDKYAQDILAMEPFEDAFLDRCVNIFPIHLAVNFIFKITQVARDGREPRRYCF